MLFFNRTKQAEFRFFRKQEFVMGPKYERNLTCIEIEPTMAAKKSVIWLHGLGADGSDFVPIVPELKLPASLGIRFLFPHAPIIPVTINSGYQMRAWYDIVSLNLDQHIDQTSMTHSVRLIQELIEQENNRGIATENIMLAGFSQGSVIALMTGLFYPRSLAGIIALSGYLPIPQEALSKASPVNQKLPIFMGHGTEDAMVPYALGKAAYLTLNEAHYDVSWHSYQMAHAVCAEEILDLSLWLKEIWKT